ncbi:MAG: zf-HC2 domain-containing protein [Candidatus Omnitrophota bacterium]
MKCKKIQNLIATGYLDGELDIHTKASVDAHLSSCEQCRMFYKTLVRVTVEPFKAVVPVEPPKEVWSGIESAIRREKEKRNIFITLKTNLQALFYIPKPAYVFATVMVIVLCAGVFTKIHFEKQELYQAYLDAESEAFAKLFNATADKEPIDNDDIGFGTTIEKYFM